MLSQIHTLLLSSLVTSTDFHHNNFVMMRNWATKSITNSGVMNIARNLVRRISEHVLGPYLLEPKCELQIVFKTGFMDYNGVFCIFNLDAWG